MYFTCSFCDIIIENFGHHYCESGLSSRVYFIMNDFLFISDSRVHGKNQYGKYKCVRKKRRWFFEEIVNLPDVFREKDLTEEELKRYFLLI